MSRFNGSKDPLTSAEVLVEIARRTPWGSEGERNEVIECLQKEFGFWNEPDTSADPEDVARAKEAVALSAEVAQLRKEKADRDRDDELEALRRERDSLKGDDADADADDKAAAAKKAPAKAGSR